jgi:hypothetical protein
MREPALLRMVSASLVFAAIWLGRPPSAAACTCQIDPETGMVWFSDPDVIFKGTSVSNAEPTSIDLGNGSSWPKLRYRMRVERYYKGRLGPDIDVISDDWKTHCGLFLERGESYLVYANFHYQEPGTLEVSRCSHTVPVSQADEALASLGRGMVPVGTWEESGGCSVAVPKKRAGAVASAVGAALLLGVASLRARGRAGAGSRS